MKTYIALLRGINVSGNRPVKMDALRTLCGQLKFKNTRTYIQSGNIVFEFKETKNEVLEKLLTKKIKEVFGFDVPVLVKQLNELKAAAQNNPFVNVRNEDLSKLHITFFSTLPEPTAIEKITAGTYHPDECITAGNCVYLFCPAGYGNTKLNNAFFENKLKTAATTRNWKTITVLIEIGEETDINLKK